MSHSEEICAHSNMQTAVPFARSRCSSPGILSVKHAAAHQRAVYAPPRRNKRWCGTLAAKVSSRSTRGLWVPSSALTPTIAPQHPTQQVDQLLIEGEAKYAAGERVAALSCFEAALQENLSRQQRVAAAWNSACVHAYYGDVELAQVGRGCLLKALASQGAS